MATAITLWFAIVFIILTLNAIKGHINGRYYQMPRQRPQLVLIQGGKK